MSSMPPPPPPPPPPPSGGGRPPGFTPYAAAGGPVPVSARAGFGARLGGYLLDSLLYGLFAAVFIIPAFILGAMAVEDCERTTVGDTTDISCSGDELQGGYLAGAIAIGVIGAIVIAVIYIRALGRTGQTWGRKIAGVKVVTVATGEPIGIGKAIGRQLLEGILGQVCLLNYLWMLWDKEKQTWHDKIMNTTVVKV